MQTRETVRHRLIQSVRHSCESNGQGSAVRHDNASAEVVKCVTASLGRCARRHGVRSRGVASPTHAVRLDLPDAGTWETITPPPPLSGTPRQLRRSVYDDFMLRCTELPALSDSPLAALPSETLSSGISTISCLSASSRCVIAKKLWCSVVAVIVVSPGAGQSMHLQGQATCVATRAFDLLHRQCRLTSTCSLAYHILLST